MAEQYNTIYKYWKFIEKSLRQQTLAMKYQNLLTGCLLSNPISAKMAFEGQTDESNIQLASMAYSTINDNDVKVSDADLKAKYDEQKEMYKQYVESRDIKYVEFQVLPSAADRKAMMATMTEAQQKLQAGNEPAEVVRKAQSQYAYVGLPVTRKAFPRDIAAKIDSMAVGQTTAPFETTADNTLNVVKLISKTQLPDSVEYRQIQIVGATVEAGRKTADSVYAALQAGAPFDSIAKKYSQTGAKQWLTSAMYENSQTVDADSKIYLETLNTLGVNEIKNISFAQGNVIVQVLSRKAMVDKYVAAVVKHTIDFSKATYSAAYNKFSQFVSGNQTVEDMEKNAGKFGYKVLERKDLFNSEHTVADISSTGEAMKWIFDAKAGQVSPLYECGANDHLLVVAMTKIHPVGYRALDDVKDIVKAEVVRDKKYDMLKGKLAGAKSVADAKAKGARVDTVRQITFSAPVFVSSTGASEPALSGAVAATKKGAFCPSVIKGNAGAYMFQVIDKKQRQGAKYDEKAMEMQLRQHRRRREEIQIHMPRLEEEIARAQASILSIEKAQSGLESKLAALNHQIQRQKASLEFFRPAGSGSGAHILSTEKKRRGERALHRLQADYEACRQTREAADTRIKALQEQLEEAQDDVLPGLLAQAGEHQKTMQEMQRRREALLTQQERNQHAWKALREAVRQRGEVQEKWTWIRALSNTANGTVPGKDKIMLETYVQMTWFDRILARANLRLMAMTSGRYELLRRQGAENQRSRSGLELNVLDHYEGGQRSVKTLSGGESFQASLALALGWRMKCRPRPVDCGWMCCL